MTVARRDFLFGSLWAVFLALFPWLRGRERGLQAAKELADYVAEQCRSMLASRHPRLIQAAMRDTERMWSLESSRARMLGLVRPA